MTGVPGPADRDVPPLVTLTVWGVATRHVPAAVTRMATGRLALRGTPGLRFAKLLGTGDGRTFTARDADPHHWGLLAVWDSETAQTAFRESALHRGWSAIAAERLDAGLVPLVSRGLWSGRAPFGDPVPTRTGGPVAAITRARLRWRTARAFWSAVPPVSADLHAGGGLLFALGIGEAPIGLQGTFSIWDSAASLTAFAHRRSPHSDVVRRTALDGWYAEELFARFAVRWVDGTFAGRNPIAAADVTRSAGDPGARTGGGPDGESPGTPGGG